MRSLDYSCPVNHHVPSLPEFVLHLLGLHFIFLSYFGLVRFASLWAESLLSDSFPFVMASPLDLHDFNPPPFWAVIQSVKQQLFCTECSQSHSCEYLPAFFFFCCNPIWCPNDHPHFHTEYWRGERCTPAMSPISRCCHAVMNFHVVTQTYLGNRLVLGF